MKKNQAKPKAAPDPRLEALREYALTYPGAAEDHPWGELVIKVNGKIFLFMGRADDEENRGVGVKLPETGQFVLMNSYAKPAGYGMGKHGWVNVHLKPGVEVPVEEMKAWIDESYRAVAPKKLAALLEEPAPQDAAPRAKARKRTARK